MPRASGLTPDVLGTVKEALEAASRKNGGQGGAGALGSREEDELELGIDGLSAEGEDDEFQEMAEEMKRLAVTGDWWPFKTKQLYLVSLFANFRRHPVSREMIRTVLLFAQILGAPNIPSYYAHSEEMKRVQKISNKPPIRRRVGGEGNIYYAKSLTAAVERDFLNPRLASTLRFYPRRKAGLKDLFDGNYLNHKIPPSLGTPMVRISDHDFYLFEPVKHRSGSIFSTIRWFEMEEVMWGEGYEVELDGGTLKLGDKTLEKYRVDDLIIAPEGLETLSSYSVDEEELLLSTNPLRVEANGLRFLSVPLAIQMDDLSGARSKKWNPHYAVQFTNAALPRSIRHEESAIRVFTVGHRAKPLELAEGLAQDLNEAFVSPVKMINTADNDEAILVRIYPLILLGDNVMFSELCSHVGQAGNHPCRSCHVGGNKQERWTVDGIASFLEVSRLRDSAETLATIKKQLDAAFNDNKKEVDNLQRTTGIADKIAQDCCTVLLEANDIFNGKNLPAGPARRAAKLSKREKQDKMELVYGGLAANSHNPLLDMANGPLHFDVHQRTAADLLHGVPLGPIKYLVKATKARLSRASKDKLRHLSPVPKVYTQSVFVTMSACTLTIFTFICPPGFSFAKPIKGTVDLDYSPFSVALSDESVDTTMTVKTYHRLCRNRALRPTGLTQEWTPSTSTVS
ncbi:hypothetical protein JCM16303_005089 [Sporobolomyces ruberrimus]